ncbi:MAG: hypothetical protein LBH25_11755 [Fibromonadaceae bacterium]|jgi:hypothetical protein|nr:hypothetical protein [Fibromonadaceae bacterium]
MFVFPQGTELISFLEKESRLRGPAANLNLVKQFAEEATAEQIDLCLEMLNKISDVSTAASFVAMCGVAASGNPEVFRKAASSSNWQVREAAVIGLQKLGLKNLDSLYAIFDSWENASLLEKRCIAATLCEPALIKNEEMAEKLLTVLNTYMQLIELKKNVKSEEYKAFKKAMGYCISVVIAASPKKGKEFFEGWMQSPSFEVRWVLSDNLKHDRLRKVDSRWVDAQIEALSDVD